MSPSGRDVGWCAVEQSNTLTNIQEMMWKPGTCAYQPLSLSLVPPASLVGGNHRKLCPYAYCVHMHLLPHALTLCELTVAVLIICVFRSMLGRRSSLSHASVDSSVPVRRLSFRISSDRCRMRSRSYGHGHVSMLWHR
jgi:hypothetical protein